MQRILGWSIVAALVLLAWGGVASVSAGGGCHRTDQVPPIAEAGSSLTVRMQECQFLPAINQIPVGSLVTFQNGNETVHDVTGRAGTWGSATLEGGGAFRHRFTESGIYAYSCSLHPGMAGVIVVGDVLAAGSAPAAPQAALTTPTSAPTTDSATTPDASAVAFGALGGATAGVALMAFAMTGLRRRSISRETRTTTPAS